MTWNGKRWSYFWEALAFSAFIGLYIWRLQAEAQWTWVFIAVWLLVSFLIRRDSAKTVGLQADNVWNASKHALWFFIPSALAIACIGVFLGMLHRLPGHVLDPRRFASYLAFCLLQQIGLNSLVTNRLFSAFEQRVPAAIAAGVIFAALHWPNPVLVPLTFIGGAGMAWLFATERNILPLTIGQAILGTLVWWAFPLAWHHSMRVGPGFFAYHLR